MFGEATIFYTKIWNHPVETTIYKWLALGFQGGICCETLDIQTHMMRIGMNEPPFTSPDPKKGLQRVPNSHPQIPGMTGGWLDVYGCEEAQTRKSRNLNRKSKDFLRHDANIRNETRDRQKR